MRHDIDLASCQNMSTIEHVEKRDPTKKDQVWTARERAGEG